MECIISSFPTTIGLWEFDDTLQHFAPLMGFFLYNVRNNKLHALDLQFHPRNDELKQVIVELIKVEVPKATIHWINEAIRRTMILLRNWRTTVK